MLVLVSAFAAVSLNLTAQSGPPITDWREAARCMAVFEIAAEKSFEAHAENADDGHDQRAVQYDEWAVSLFASMGERLDFQQLEQAETIRAREAEALHPLSLDQARARVEDCRARLPDPPTVP